MYAQEVPERKKELEEKVDILKLQAEYQELEGRFRGALKMLIYGAVVTAIGIMAFVWASNPQVTPPKAKTTYASITAVLSFQSPADHH